MIFKNTTVVQTIVAGGDLFENSWERQFDIHHTDDFQMLHAMIYANEKVDQLSIRLYRFDDDTFKAIAFTDDGQIRTDQQWKDHREQYLIHQEPLVDYELGSESIENSNIITQAMKKIMAKVKMYAPSDRLVLKYTGHGTGYGLFETTINRDEHVKDFLGYVVDLYGKKIDLLDWNTNCNVNALPLLQLQSDYADYMIASDLGRGGYSPAPTWEDKEKGIVSYAEYQKIFKKYFYGISYSKLWDSNKSMKELAIEYADIELAKWRSQFGKSSMIENKTMQSLHVFDLAKFKALENSIFVPRGEYYIKNDSGKTDVTDLKSYLTETNQTNGLAAFDNFIVHSVDNRDFFTWPAQRSGIYLGVMYNDIGQKENLDKVITNNPDYSSNFWISNVQLNGVNSDMTLPVYQDNENNLIVSIKSDDSAADITLTVWVDLNNDNDFDEMGEMIVRKSVNVNTDSQVVIPAIEFPNSKMRLMLSNGEGHFPEETPIQGDVKDYQLDSESLDKEDSINNQPEYTQVNAASSDYIWISQVQFNGVSNPSSASGYSDFSDKKYSLNSNGSNTISVKVSDNGSRYGVLLKAWVDINLDGDFTDQGESIAHESGLSNSLYTFELPVINTDKPLRLRLMLSNGDGLEANISPAFGEIEDYTIEFN